MTRQRFSVPVSEQNEDKSETTSVFLTECELLSIINTACGVTEKWQPGMRGPARQSEQNSLLQERFEARGSEHVDEL